MDPIDKFIDKSKLNFTIKSKNINLLPDELLVKIFSPYNLILSDILHCGLVNHKWRKITEKLKKKHVTLFPKEIVHLFNYQRFYSLPFYKLEKEISLVNCQFGKHSIIKGIDGKGKRFVAIRYRIYADGGSLKKPYQTGFKKPKGKHEGVLILHQQKTYKYQNWSVLDTLGVQPVSDRCMNHWQNHESQKKWIKNLVLGKPCGQLVWWASPNFETETHKDGNPIFQLV